MDAYETWFLARSARGWIQGRENIGIEGALSSKDFFRSESYSNKPSA